MNVDFDSLSAKEQFDYLTKLEERGERLKPKQRALKNRLEKEILSNVPVIKDKEIRSNLFGKVSTSTVNPKAVRFLQTERDLLTERTNSLNINSTQALLLKSMELNQEATI